jgi:hypothetical protein
VGDSATFVNGTLTEDFAAPVASNLVAQSYLHDDDLGRMAGPFFDDRGYRFTLIGLQRHDTVTVSEDVVLLGDVEADNSPREAARGRQAGLQRCFGAR